METSADDHLKNTIKQILNEIQKLFGEQFPEKSQIEELVRKIQAEILQSDAKDLVILKQQLSTVLTDMENMVTRAFKDTSKTSFIRAMLSCSSSKDRPDAHTTEKKEVMWDLKNTVMFFQIDRKRRSLTKNIYEKSWRDLELVGREKEKEEIIDQLILLSRSGKVPVIIIAGLSGLGKTKLASYVCEDRNVQQEVGMAAWVSTGVHYNTFDADSIAKRAIRSVLEATKAGTHQQGRMTENNNLNIIVILDDCLDWSVEIEDKDVKALQDKLKEAWRVEIEGTVMETLQDKLKEAWRVEIEGIVMKASQKELKDVEVEIEGIDVKASQEELEDVEDEIEGIDLKAVDKLKEARPLVTAVMIITTSSCHVAMARNITASPVKSYALPELNENEVEHLLLLLMARDTGDNWIVGKARGVPRALLTAIKMFPFQLTDSGLLEELTYTYYNEGLPHLCFAYCSLFPQDYLFDAERLIHLWMAEGFLNPSTSSSTSEADKYLMAEEIGRKYLMDLVGRSIFQDVKENELGQIRSFRMHPLMHDIARSVADRESITVDPKGYKVHQKVLRASFDLRLHFSHGIPSHPLFYKAKQLKSILFFAAKTQSSWLHRHVGLENIFKSFKSLVVLDLRGLKITAVPNSIGELTRLEYLDLSQNDMEKLPSSITKLSKLQTLKLSRCYSLRELPKDFKNLKKLKHLDMEGCMGLTGMPPQMSDLRSSLQTLTAFVASKNETMGGLEELEKLDQLRGYLEILYLDRVRNPDGETNAKYLKEKQHLQRLKLKWDLGVGHAVGSVHKSVLDSLEPHSHLGVLFLEGYQGASPSNWLTSIQFTCLVKLSLHNCPGCRYLSEDDQLPKLKILQLVRLENLFYIVEKPNKDAYFYKTLQELTIIDCPILKGWWLHCPAEVEIFFPRISKLHVHNCPNLEEMPRLDVEGSTSTSFGKELVLEGSSLNLLLKSIKASIPFENLHIKNCKDLKKLSDVFQHLGSLQRLTIENCAEIKLEDDKSKLLEELEKKKIYAKYNFEDDESNQYWEGLKSMRFLTLREMPNIRSLSFGDSVATLRELTLHSCHGLTSISDSMIGKLTSLRELSLHNCHGLTSISDSIGNVTSLRRLEISKCNKLKALPKTMENLESLKTLIILDCDLLLPRCQEETGADWPQIRHIKHRDVK